MVKRDLNTLDLVQQKLRLADDVMVWPVRECGELVYRFEIPSLHRFFRVGYAEYVLISLLDGNTTVPQACGLAASKLGPDAPTTAQASTIARWLLENGLACMENEPSPIRQSNPVAVSGHRQQSGMGWRRILKGINPFWMKVPFPASGVWVPKLAESLKPLGSVYLIVGSLILCLLAAFQFILHADQFLGTSVDVFHKSNWIYLFITWILLKFIHELAHAVACARAGAEVSEAGMVFVLFAPLAYVDVTSCWRLSNRWKRICVAAAGMQVELVIASVAFLLWLNVTNMQAKYILDNIVWMAGLSTLLFNLNVLMRFDGYYILADLIEVPNLYGEASKSVQGLFQRVIVGQQPEISRLQGWRRRFVLVYGLASLGWRIFVCASLAIAASVMFSGAGILLAGIGICSWFASPVKRLGKFLHALWRSEPERFVRALVFSVIGLALGYTCLFLCPFPTAIRVPAIVEYTPSTIVRSGATGFVSKIHVTEGQQVERGDLLLEISNDELANRLAQLEIKRRQSEIRISMAVDAHDAAQTHVHRQAMAAVAEQIENLRQQVENLTVTAPRSGNVVARDLKNKIGIFVKEGDQLLAVADTDSKEIIAMIGQQEVDEVRALVDSKVEIYTADSMLTAGFLDRVEPRATDLLAWKALAATQGGPLAVRENHEEEESPSLRLLEPLFQARIHPTAVTAVEIPPGIRAQVWIGYRRETIATRANEWIARWWQDANAQQKFGD